MCALGYRVWLGDAMMHSSLEECMFADDIILHMRVCSNLDMISLQSDVTMVADWVESTDLYQNKSAYYVLMCG